MKKLSAILFLAFTVKAFALLNTGGGNVGGVLVFNPTPLNPPSLGNAQLVAGNYDSFGNFQAVGSQNFFDANFSGSIVSLISVQPAIITNVVLSGFASILSQYNGTYYFTNSAWYNPDQDHWLFTATNTADPDSFYSEQGYVWSIFGGGNDWYSYGYGQTNYAAGVLSSYSFVTNFAAITQTYQVTAYSDGMVLSNTVFTAQTDILATNGYGGGLWGLTASQIAGLGSMAFSNRLAYALLDGAPSIPSVAGLLAANGDGSDLTNMTGTAINSTNLQVIPISTNASGVVNYQVNYTNQTWSHAFVFISFSQHTVNSSQTNSFYPLSSYSGTLSPGVCAETPMPQGWYGMARVQLCTGSSTTVYPSTNFTAVLVTNKFGNAAPVSTAIKLLMSNPSSNAITAGILFCDASNYTNSIYIPDGTWGAWLLTNNAVAGNIDMTPVLSLDFHP